MAGIDLDALVLGPCNDSFGEPATFAPAAGGPSFPVTGIYTEGYHPVQLSADEPIATSSTPAFGVRLVQFAQLGKAEPVQGDQVTITRLGQTFAVKEVRPDGVGEALLLLNYLSG